MLEVVDITQVVPKASEISKKERKKIYLPKNNTTVITQTNGWLE